MRTIISGLIILLLLLFASCRHHNGENVAGQTPNILTPDSIFESTGDAQLDSLLQLAAVAPQDTSLAKMYKQIADLYYYADDLLNAKDYYLKLKGLSEKLNWSNGIFMYAPRYSELLSQEGMSDSTIVILKQVLELAKKEMDEIQIAKMSVNIGLSYLQKQWYVTSLEYFYQALPIFENKNEKFRLAHLYSMLAVVYTETDMHEERLLYCEKAVNILYEKPDTLLRAEALCRYGMALIEDNQFDKAEINLMEAQRICMLYNNKKRFCDIYSHLGDLALSKFELDKSEMYFRKSLEIATELNIITHYCYMNRMIGRTEFYRGNLDKAEKYAKEALEVANEYDITNQKLECYLHLMDISSARRDFINFNLYEKTARSIEREIKNETTKRTAREMSAKYETEKKQLEIERQQAVIARQNMQRWLFVGGIAVCVVFLALLWNMVRLRNRRNHALTEMNATKDKFFNIISHDLKNPAISQRDALQMLINNAHLWDVDRLTNYYHELLKSAEGEVELIYNLLGWAQLQTGRITYTPSTFNLAHRLRSDISLIRNMAEKKEVALAVTIPEDADVTGDGNMISTVVRNLLSNAVKFTPSGGQVTLEVSPRHDDKYTVTITDTGIGMNNEQLEMLRTPSLQNAHSRKGTAGEQGSGLGLIVCHELLEKHGSKLYIDSEEGKGSRFYFELTIDN